MLAVAAAKLDIMGWTALSTETTTAVEIATTTTIVVTITTDKANGFIK
jgi:hypothetical protein